MFRNRLLHSLKTVYRTHKRTVACKIRNLAPVPLGLLVTVRCEDKGKDSSCDCEDSLSHEFLIRQAATVNVNAATQLLTVTVVAIQDTGEKLREQFKKEICLLKQTMDMGNCTPKQHWDNLIAVRHHIADLKHNLQVLHSYLDYAEKLATASAEISYLSGNVAASDAICARVEQANRTVAEQKAQNDCLQKESLETQKKAICTIPNLEDKIKRQ